MNHIGEVSKGIATSRTDSGFSSCPDSPRSRAPSSAPARQVPRSSPATDSAIRFLYLLRSHRCFEMARGGNARPRGAGPIGDVFGSIFFRVVIRSDSLTTSKSRRYLRKFVVSGTDAVLRFEYLFHASLTCSPRESVIAASYRRLRKSSR